jgi:hypothetical protein
MKKITWLSYSDLESFSPEILVIDARNKCLKRWIWRDQLHCVWMK